MQCAAALRFHSCHVVSLIDCLCCHSSLLACRGVAVDTLLQQLPQFTDTTVVAAVTHSDFWQLAQLAATQQSAVNQDLQLLGYDLQAAVSNSLSQTQQIQQVLGLQAADLQRQLLAELKVTPSILVPDQQKRLLGAIGSNSRALSLLSRLQLLQYLAYAVGYSSVHVLGAVSPADLVQRLTGVAAPHQPVDKQLLQQLQACAPELIATASQVSGSGIEQPSVGKLLQMMNSRPNLQVGHLEPCSVVKPCIAVIASNMIEYMNDCN